MHARCTTIRDYFVITTLIFACFMMILYADSTDKNMQVDKCSKGYVTSCIVLGKDSHKYHKYIVANLQRACQKEYKACLALAEMYNPNPIYNYNTQNLQPLPDADPINQSILTSLQQSQHEFTISVKGLRALGIPTDAKEALKYQEKAVPLMESACYVRAQKDMQACIALSYFYEKGIAVPLNRHKAQRLIESVLDSFMKECLFNDTTACIIFNQYPDYLKMINSEISTIIMQCNEGDFLSCLRASLYYTQHFSIPRFKNVHANNDQQNNKPKDNETEMDFLKSALFLQKACNLESQTCENILFTIPFARACLMQNDMQACAKVQSNRPEFYSLACEGGNISSCYKLRYLPIFDNTKKLVALSQRACKGGVIEACADLARRYKVGDKVQQNEERSLHFMQRACNWELKQKAKESDSKPDSHTENTEYCYESAYGYETGEFVKQDITKAMQLYEYSCAFNPNACDRLARLYQVYKKDSETALKLYQHACDNGASFAKGCAEVANRYFLKATQGEDSLPNILLAIAYNQKASKLQGKSALDSLYQLGTIYSLEGFNNTDTSSRAQRATQPNPYKNYALAAQYYHEACQKGSLQACTKYKQYKQEKQQELQQLCTIERSNEHSSACYQLLMYDLLFTQSQQKRFTPAEAFGMLVTSCESNMPSSCASLIRLSSHKEYQEYFRATTFKQNMYLQGRLCRISKDRLYDIISHNNNTGDFCANFANLAYQQRDYAKFIEALRGYEYGFIMTIPVENALDKLVQAYFVTQRYDDMLGVYRYIYANHIPNSYYFLAKAYQEGLGVEKNLQRAIMIYQLGVYKESAQDSLQDDEMDHFALSYLGLAQSYQEGLGVAKDNYKAIELLRLACPLHTEIRLQTVAAEACALLSKEFSRDGDLEEAKAYYQRACEAQYQGDIVSCKSK
ncbi:tetratricopeptide repeat protein [Helicobacter aurati]|nr:SEL1-like repeat protein [Helicobacter aurati]